MTSRTRVRARLALAWKTLALPAAKAMIFGRGRTVLDQASVIQPVCYLKPREVSGVLFRRVQRTCAPGSLVGALLISGSLMGLLTAGCLAAQSLNGFAIMLFICVILMAYLAALQLSIHHAASPERVRDAWLSAGYCPSCVYSLRVAGSRESIDELVRCPECAGVWLVSSVGFEPLPPDPTCTRCAYSLIGLPGPKKCPECGEIQLHVKRFESGSSLVTRSRTINT